MSRNHLEVQIILHKGLEYMPGDTMSGLVVVVVRKEVPCYRVRLRINGEEYAKVLNDEQWEVNSHVHYDKIYTFDDTAWSTKEDADTPRNGSENSASRGDKHGMNKNSREFQQIILQPGLYTYPFEILLPPCLPPSFDIRTSFGLAEARILYKLQAYIDLHLGIDAICERTFYVYSTMKHRQYDDLNGPLFFDDMEAGSAATFQGCGVVIRAPIHNSGLLSCFSRGDDDNKFVATYAKAVPVAAVMDGAPVIRSPRVLQSRSDRTQPPTNIIRVYVTVRNSTKRTLRTTRVEIKNIVDIKPSHHTRTRNVSVGQPFIYGFPIAPGKEASFVAPIDLRVFPPISSLETQNEEHELALRLQIADSSELAVASNIPRRKQKQYMLQERPLVSVTTAFVKSRCVICVDFTGRGVTSGAVFEDPFFLIDAVDEQNRCPLVPTVYDTRIEDRLTRSPNAYAMNTCDSLEQSAGMRHALTKGSHKVEDTINGDYSLENGFIASGFGNPDGDTALSTPRFADQGTCTIVSPSRSPLLDTRNMRISPHSKTPDIFATVSSLRTVISDTPLHLPTQPNKTPKIRGMPKKELTTWSPSPRKSAHSDGASGRSALVSGGSTSDRTRFCFREERIAFSEERVSVPQYTFPLACIVSHEYRVALSAVHVCKRHKVFDKNTSRRLFPTADFQQITALSECKGTAYVPDVSTPDYYVALSELNEDHHTVREVAYSPSPVPVRESPERFYGQHQAGKLPGDAPGIFPSYSGGALSPKANALQDIRGVRIRSRVPALEGGVRKKILLH